MRQTATRASSRVVMASSDSDDAWLDDVAPAPRRASASASREATTTGERTVATTTNDDDARRDDATARDDATTTTTRGPFGVATPTMGERATTPTRREEAAFATTPTTPRTREDAPTGFVEVANGDLGALFGGCEGDDDWLTPTGGGGEVGASASASARSEASAGAVRAAATATAAVTYATNAPFASPAASRDDGMGFFDDLDAAEETVSAPAVIPFEARASGAAEAPARETYAASENVAEANEIASVAAEARAPVIEATSFAPTDSAPDRAFYEETHAPAAEYPQAEFVGERETSDDFGMGMTSHAHATAYEQHAPEQYARQGFSQPLASASHEDQPNRALELREPPRSAYADYGENDVTADLSAPPIVPAYSSENLHSRVSSSNSVSDMQAPPQTPPKPTFMVPTPIEDSPMAYVHAVPHALASASPVPFTPPPRASAGYDTYEPARVAQPEYPPVPAPSANHGGYAPSYEAHSTQQLEYAAYSETETLKPANYDDTDRSPHGRPQHVAMSFGFGGSLILSGPGYPGGRISHGTSIPPCSLRVHSVGSMLKDGNTLGMSYVRSMEAFDGPLGNRRQADVTKMMDSALSSGGERQQSEVTLYRVLQTMLRHKGEISTPGDLLGENRKGAVAELASVLAGDAQAASDGGWVSANVAASPLNPSGEGDAQQIVQIENLLIAGRRGEALQAAVAAKLWPHALLLASHMGGRHYHETVSIMAKSVCRVGSPLHTLEVVMAGIPQELTTSGVEAAPNVHGMQVPEVSQIRELLPRWREHIAILCSNPAKGSDFVLKALGDELWCQNDITAAHVAYALSKQRPTPYSFNSRLCLIGADHRKFPRTYVTPRAVHLTEIFELAVLGSNPQAQLPSLLPYKLLYAGALAEVGKLKPALAYVESVLKSVRSLDRNSPEVNGALVGMLAAQMEDRLHNSLRGKTGRLADAAAGAAKVLVSGVKGLLDRSVSSLFGDGGEFQASPLGPPHEPRPHTPPDAYQQQPVQMHHTLSSAHSQAAPVVQPPPAHVARHERTPSGNLLRSMSSLFGGVAPKPQPANEPTMSQENVFYYDDERKMWLERGRAPPKEAPPVGAPPLRSEQSAASEIAGPPPVMAPSTHAKQQGGVHTRYVSTFSTTSTPTVAPQGFVPVAPNAGACAQAPAQFFMPSAVAPAHSAHSRNESSESQSSASYAAHERTASQDGFYGYEALASESSHPPPAGAIPRPPTIDPALLAPSFATSAPLPVIHHTSASAAPSVDVVADDFTDLRLQ